MKTHVCLGWVGWLGLGLIEGGARLSAQTPPQFTATQVLTNGEVALRLAATAGQTYRLETSGNLDDWAALVTFGGAPTVEHVDSTTPRRDARFYRARQLDDPATFTGDHLATTQGDAVIRPLNHASLVVQWNGLTIYVDPVAAAGPFTASPKADLILITHGHGDHLDAGSLNTLRKAETILLAPTAVQGTLSATLKPLTVRLDNGGETNLLGLTVEAVPAYNGNHPKGAGNGYLVTLGGKRLYVSGDTGPIVELQGLADLDVAFVCMNVPYTMTVAQAVSAVRGFRPRVIYPYHYRNADGTFADLNEFKRQVAADPGIEVRLRKWY